MERGNLNFDAKGAIQVAEP